MRFARFGLFYLLFFVVPVGAQQATLSPGQAQAPQPAPQPVSDPQAVAVVQAAITALGGATAIGQAQSWAFQAQMQGPHANGNVDYMISTHTDTGKLVRLDGTTRPAPAIHSHFVPALAGAILLKESQDPNFSMQYAGLSTGDSKPITVIVFMVGKTQFPAQIWTFDAANLPVQIDFRLPAEIGARESFPIVVALSDYRTVSGVLYPFQIVSFLPGKPPEIVTLQSVSTSVTAVPNDYNGPAGDLR
jgi:hypothetical protein